MTTQGLREMTPEQFKNWLRARRGCFSQEEHKAMQRLQDEKKNRAEVAQ